MQSTENVRRAACAGALAICTGLAFAAPPRREPPKIEPASVGAILEELVEALQPTAAPFGIPDPLTDDDFRTAESPLVRLGGLLFHDKILSGNLNTSCATCHHMLADTGDGLSLSVGEGGLGLGVSRNTGVGADAVHQRVPRNAPPIFNLGAYEFETMFHDGRVQANPMHPSGFDSPAGLDLPPGLDSALAAQAMFPVTSTTEMAGQAGENPVAAAAAAGQLTGGKGVWVQLVRRLQGIPEYAGLFAEAFDDLEGPADITFVHAANAIAAWEAVAFRADNSPFDRSLRGERQAMSQSARRGMHLFYGPAGCADCHSGPLQTNHGFYAIAMPQIGPGKGDNLPGYDDGHDDFGRERVTGDPADRFRFRVPSLRNVALTGPWGHDGAYNTLEAVVRHHLDPVGGLFSYDASQRVLPSRPDLDAIDLMCFGDATRRDAVANANELAPAALSPNQVKHLVDFLHALTDPASIDLRHAFPMEVPSGLPVFD